jgi:integrase
VSGSVRKRTGSRGDSWYYTIDVGYHPDGRRKQKTVRGFTSKKAADAAMQKELTERRAGTYFEPSAEPLGPYLERWLAATTHRRRPSTTNNYREAIARLKPIHSVPLAALTPLLIQSTYSDLLERLAPSTLGLTHRVLKMGLAQAVKWRMLQTNPAEGVDVPRVVSKPLETWTEAEMRAFLAGTAGAANHALWQVMLDTGVRLGEVQTLRWSDVDLPRRRVAISRTMTRDDDGRAVIGADAKTAAGRRTIPISETTVAVLTAHRQQQRLERIRLGPFWQDQDLVFTRGDGGPLLKGAISGRLAADIAAVGVRRLTPHGLRHTNATLLIRAGVPVKVVRYVHPDAEDSRGAADALERMFQTGS